MIYQTFRLALFDPLDDSIPDEVVGVPWLDSPDQRERAQEIINQFNSEQCELSASFLLMRIHKCKSGCGECPECLARAARLRVGRGIHRGDLRQSS